MFLDAKSDDEENAYPNILPEVIPIGNLRQFVTFVLFYITKIVRNDDF